MHLKETVGQQLCSNLSPNLPEGKKKSPIMAIVCTSWGLGESRNQVLYVLPR